MPTTAIKSPGEWQVWNRVGNFRILSRREWQNAAEHCLVWGKGIRFPAAHPYPKYLEYPPGLKRFHLKTITESAVYRYLRYVFGITVSFHHILQNCILQYSIPLASLKSKRFHYNSQGFVAVYTNPFFELESCWHDSHPNENGLHLVRHTYRLMARSTPSAPIPPPPPGHLSFEFKIVANAPWWGF